MIVSARKKGSSVWYGSYYGPDGKRVQVCTKQQDRVAARLVLRDLEREAQGSLSERAKSGEAGITIAEALHYLVDYGCGDCAPATKGMYRQLMGHVSRGLGDHDIAKLTMDDVHGYIQMRLGEEAHRETIRKELVALRRALTLQHERGKLKMDPRGVVPRFKGRYIPKSRHLTRVEFERVLAMLQPARRLWLALAVFSGGRLSEIEGVTWETVDLENGRLLLPGTKTNKSRRWVPIAEPLKLLLSEIHQDARSGAVVPPWVNVRRDLRQLVKAYNKEEAELAAKEKRTAPKPMEPFSPNDLRRTFASWLKQAGVDSMVVAKLLGHTTSRMVELVYGHLNDATTTAAIARLPTAIVPTLAEPAIRPCRTPSRAARSACWPTWPHRRCTSSTPSRNR